MNNRQLLVSVHDVAPAFEPQADRLLALLHPHVGQRLAMLIVPRHWASEPIRAGTPFAARLRAWSDAGIEMFLHGWTHRDHSVHRGQIERARARHMTAGEGEFLGLDYAAARQRIGDGRGLIEDITGRPIAGFVAPAWLYGEPAKRALTDCGIALAEDHFRVWSPISGETLLSGPVITWASRSRPRMLSSLAVAALARTLPAPPRMRVAVHPHDVTQPRILRSIDSTLAHLRRSRAAGNYASLRPS